MMPTRIMAYQSREELTQIGESTSPWQLSVSTKCVLIYAGIDVISYQVEAKKKKYWDRDRLNDIMFNKLNTSKVHVPEIQPCTMDGY